MILHNAQEYYNIAVMNIRFLYQAANNFGFKRLLIQFRLICKNKKETIKDSNNDKLHIMTNDDYNITHIVKHKELNDQLCLM